ncbi:metalloregulator ArsR/SmtB family transcription factor [Emcibacter nanhaiensis]|uniref:Metalloregulator ArsR/SmtB family transcription factor n=1 Tax=Emcibacter nanhaiensis TaxID=1505037 RepID=A0A501PC69_9PROT|nr:metalloregulator ArsR/SmtB family transcription factor [Emcibacter nanhaiensis]
MEEILAALRAAGEETRLRILALFRSGELTVTELVTILRQSQPRVSRHLKLLCEAGLLERHREGTWIFYRLAEQGGPGRLARSILEFVPHSDQLLQHDQERLAEIKRERTERASEYFRENAANWDKIRSLYVPEEDVESLLLELTADMEIKTLLDVGTGTGRMLEVFAPRIRKGIGIDLSREMLSIARVNLEKAGVTNCQVRHGDMYDLALPDETIDLVMFHQVLHFADDPLSALKETSRLLKKGGRAIIVDFAPHTLEFLREEHAHRRLGFSDREINGWCKQVGLMCDNMIPLKGSELDVSIWVARKN